MNKKLTQKYVSLFLILVMLHLSVGCNYYKVRTIENAQTGVEEMSSDKYVIVHFGSETFSLVNVYVDKDANTIWGTKNSITSDHMGHNNPKPRNNRYKRKLSNPTNEVHIYANSYKINDESGFKNVTISIDDIERLDVYDPQVGTTIATYTFAAIGAVGLVIGIIILIALLTKSSCPFVYIHDGEKYVFQGETFGGAISQNLERDDYMPLDGINPVNGEYLLKITNELKERQYTDIAELLFFDHSKSAQVGVTQDGVFYELNELQPASKMIADNGLDITHFVVNRDSVYYSFVDPKNSNDDYSQVTLSFDNSNKSNSGKLMLTLKNTMWLDIMMDEFFSQFGSYYNKFQRDQNKVPANQKIQWAKDQGILMKIEQKTDFGWVEIDQLNTIGPLAPRTLIVPLENLKNTEEIEIRLTTGLHFWEIDFAAIDYSTIDPIKPAKLELISALDQDNIEIKEQLITTDGVYLDQPEIGNQAYLTFRAPELPKEKNRSLFLHTRGYYEYIRDYKGKPDVKKLEEFRAPGTFPRFAKEHINKFLVVN